MKHVPIRSCIVCRQQKDKKDLLRIVRSPNGDIAIDESGKANGRGAYVCRCGDCMSGLIKKRALNKAFKAQIDVGVYAALAAEYERLNGNGE